MFLLGDLSPNRPNLPVFLRFLMPTAVTRSRAKSRRNSCLDPIESVQNTSAVQNTVRKLERSFRRVLSQRFNWNKAEGLSPYSGSLNRYKIHFCLLRWWKVKLSVIHLRRKPDFICIGSYNLLSSMEVRQGPLAILLLDLWTALKSHIFPTFYLPEYVNYMNAYARLF